MNAKLIFNRSDVERIIKHIDSSPEQRAPYGGGYGDKAEAAVWLVKDEGIYIMSSGEPQDLVNGEHKCFVGYARGYDPTKRDRMEVWEDARAAVGGDDFVEPITELHVFRQYLDKTNRGPLTMTMTKDRITYGWTQVQVHKREDKT